MTMELAPFKEFIHKACGLLFDGAGEEKLATVLAGRIQEKGVADEESYLKMITGSEEEFQQLVNQLTINETYFFRESEQLRLLTDKLVPRLLIREGALLPIRILSAGCSSGEEPYSLAISLFERYGESLPRLCSFTGVDIDSAVMQKARNGCYTEFSFRAVPAATRSRYFDKSGYGWQLKEEIRKMVSFRELNLLAPEMPASLQGFDIIFFRNVSIYFDLTVRKLIQHNLASLMKDDGILVIGTAETIANDLGILKLVQEDELFYFIKGNPPLPEQVLAMPGPPLGQETGKRAASLSITAELPLPVLVLPDSWNSPSSPPPMLEDLRQMVLEKRYDEALPLLDEQLDREPQNQEALLLKSHILLNRKQFALAATAAQMVLEQESWSIDAFLLLGLAAKWTEQPEEALRWFKQAAYACHTCWPAHYYLADHYRAAGAIDQARREYRTVLQLLSGNVPDTGIKVVPVGLPVGEVRLLSEHQLSKLGSC